jgi:hypothetical protein
MVVPKPSICRLLQVAVLAAIMLAAGCGGQLGRNSTVQIRLEEDVTTLDFTQLHLIVSPNNGPAINVAAASDTQPQVWAEITNGASFHEIDFTTTSAQVPYAVYVQNDSVVQDRARLRVFIDGNERVETVVTVNAGAAAKVATIFRNHASQP